MNVWVEKRHSVRQTVRIEGVAVANNGLVRIPLTVVNLSRAGAMVELSDECEFPEEMVLLFN